MLQFNCPYTYAFISGLSILLHCLKCLYLCQFHLITVGLKYSLKLGSVALPGTFFLKILLTIQDSVCFHKYFRIPYFRSLKNASGILEGTALNVQTVLGSMGILTISILPIHECNMCFPFVCLIFNFFHQYHIAFYMFLTSLLKCQFIHSVVSDSLKPHGLQHTRIPCPSLTPGVYSKSCPQSP